jgi:hypothetical protein
MPRISGVVRVRLGMSSPYGHALAHAGFAHERQGEASTPSEMERDAFEGDEVESFEGDEVERDGFERDE